MSERTRTILLAIAMLTIPPGLLAADDPIMGTWKINTAKTKLGPGRSAEALTRTHEPIPDGIQITRPLVDAIGMEPAVFNQGDPETVAGIRGRGFTIGSVAYVNHHAVRTRFKSPELLEVALPPTLLSQVGTYPVQVINPHPLPPLENAGESNKMMVIVKFR